MNKIKAMQLIKTKTNMPEIIFVPVDEENFKNSLHGILLEVTSWSSNDLKNYTIPSDTDFIANIYIKWDGCSHWSFYGEDYMNDKEHEDDVDGYYHICGFDSYVKFMRSMVFGYQLAIDKLGNDFDKNIEIPEYEKFKQCINLLDGYEIKEVEYTEDDMLYWRIQDLIKEDK